MADWEYERHIGESETGEQVNAPTRTEERERPEVPQERKNLIKSWTAQIRNQRDKVYASDYARMKENLFWAEHGADRDWVANKKSRANLLGRHTKLKTADLYARNPTVVVKPMEMLDFNLWDGNPETIVNAQMILQNQMMTGVADPAAIQAMAIVQDYQQGMMLKEMRERFGDTVRLVVQRSWDKQFKAELKSAVRRSIVQGVSWIRWHIFRQDTKTPFIEKNISDTRTQLASMQAEVADISRSTEDQDKINREMEKLRLRIMALQATEPSFESGIMYSFPDATRLIPGPGAKSLARLEGSEWVAEECYMTYKEVIATFGVDISGRYKAYTTTGAASDDPMHAPPDSERVAGEDEHVCVWEVFDRKFANHFFIADGYDDFLQEPAPYPFYVKDFYPYVPIIFNSDLVEDGKLYPQSDIDLLREIQDDYNQGRQGARLHRRAGAPVYLAPAGSALSDDDLQKITDAEPFDIIKVRSFQGGDTKSLIVPLEKHPVDPALYSPADSMMDFQMTAGTQPANMQGITGATATESSIAEASRGKVTSEDADSLDDALGALAEGVALAAVDVLTIDEVKQMVGQGAMWPEVERQALANGLEIGVKGGSSGRPNKAMEMANWERIAPFAMQSPGINVSKFMQIGLERLEDDINVEDLFAPSAPSVVQMNKDSGGGAMAEGDEPGAQPAFGDSGNDKGIP